jgi:hypothetical protein
MNQLLPMKFHHQIRLHRGFKIAQIFLVLDLLMNEFVEHIFFHHVSFVSLLMMTYYPIFRITDFLQSFHPTFVMISNRLFIK